jgi:hypothetical protein
MSFIFGRLKEKQEKVRQDLKEAGMYLVQDDIFATHMQVLEGMVPAVDMGALQKVWLNVMKMSEEEIRDAIVAARSATIRSVPWMRMQERPQLAAKVRAWFEELILLENVLDMDVDLEDKRFMAKNILMDAQGILGFGFGSADVSVQKVWVIQGMPPTPQRTVPGFVGGTWAENREE